RLVHALGAGGRVAAMGDAHPPLQHAHGLGVEHVAYQAVVLVHAQARAVGSSDTRRVLAAVLEDGEGVIQLARDVLVADDSDDAAHGEDLRRSTDRGWDGKKTGTARRTAAVPRPRERAVTR